MPVMASTRTHPTTTAATPSTTPGTPLAVTDSVIAALVRTISADHLDELPPDREIVAFCRGTH